jgi:hypothetical protein
LRIPSTPSAIPPETFTGVRPLSPLEALRPAWEATHSLLFRPFQRKQWISLSVVCQFLGGGTSTAAFQWGFSALPIDFRAADTMMRLRSVLAEHASLAFLTTALTLGLILAAVYVRCVLRFALIDGIVKQHMAARAAWKDQKSNGRNYFVGLTVVIGTLLAVTLAAVFVSIRVLRYLNATGYPEWLVSVFLIAELVAVIGTGLFVAILITLTDDLVAPLIYAENISLLAAWRKTGQLAWREPGAFFAYVLLRFAIGMIISIGVLVILFPVLMGLSSLALLTAAIVLFTMRMVGFAWVWNPFTYVIAAFALGIFSSLIFALLSVVGMPGQVYLQDYGVRFMASRVESLAGLCVAPRPLVERY